MLAAAAGAYHCVGVLLSVFLVPNPTLVPVRALLYTEHRGKVVLVNRKIDVDSSKIVEPSLMCQAGRGKIDTRLWGIKVYEYVI